MLSNLTEGEIYYYYHYISNDYHYISIIITFISLPSSL